jgi:Protein of unknown function (DUF2630)
MIMVSDSSFYWLTAAFAGTLTFGAIAYPSSYLGRKIRSKKPKTEISNNSLTLMENKPKDNAVLSHIEKLTAREEHLYGSDQLSDEEIKELHHIQSELDQYWDLLHQRRALRDAGADPKRAAMRTTETIKNYVK